MIADNPRDAGLTKRWVIPIPFRLISKNKHTRYLPAKYRVFEDAIARLALVTCKRPMLDFAWVVIRPHFKNKSHIDLNNCPKSLMDGLKKGGVFKDDKIIACNTVPAVYGDEHSEIEVWS